MNEPSIKLDELIDGPIVRPRSNHPWPDGYRTGTTISSHAHYCHQCGRLIHPLTRIGYIDHHGHRDWVCVEGAEQ